MGTSDREIRVPLAPARSRSIELEVCLPMTAYRYYFMNVDHIISGAVIEASNDAHAIIISKAAYRSRKVDCTGFEVWDCDRVVHRYAGHQVEHKAKL